MDGHTLIELLKKDISNSSFDVRTEMLLALALERGLTYSDFSIHCDSNFHRNYSNDIFYTEIKEDALKRPFIEVHLTRNGLYELLPEGVFFSGKDVRENRVAGIAEVAELYKQNQQKEKEARQFFRPFENGLFWPRIQLKRKEIMLPDEPQSDKPNDYPTRFWNIPDSFPEEFITPFTQCLPYAHQIAGNFHFTALCLEYLIREKVQVREITRPATLIHSPGLSDQLLGVDMICGEVFLEDDPALEFTIGPLKCSQLQDYLEWGNRSILIETFYRFFVPAGLDVQTKIEASAEDCGRPFNTVAESVLGYSTLL